jgi:hypothetical protein
MQPRGMRRHYSGHLELSPVFVKQLLHQSSYSNQHLLHVPPRGGSAEQRRAKRNRPAKRACPQIALRYRVDYLWLLRMGKSVFSVDLANLRAMSLAYSSVVVMHRTASAPRSLCRVR